MSNRNLSRALVAVSGTLGTLVDRSAQRDHERVMTMRQENFARLQHMLGEESRDKDRTMRKEELATEIGARRDMFKEEVAAREGMFEKETAARRTENETERGWRSSENAKDRAVQLAQIQDKDKDSFEKDYLSRLQQVDKRIQELTDYKTQGTAEGKFVDTGALGQIDSELAQLTESRRALAQERDVVLARTGDPRYRKLSAEEVARLRKEGRGQVPNQSPTADPAPLQDRQSDIPMAAQAPRGGSGIKVPQMPPKPEGMMAREARRQPPPARGAAAGGEELALGSWETATNPAQPESRAFQGARDIAKVGRSIVGSLDAKKREGSETAVANRVKKVLESGNIPNAELVKELAKIDRKRLTTAFGINEEDLAALGL